MHAAKAKLLQYPPPPVLTPQLITAASVISTRLYGLFDLGVFIAKLVEAGVQRYGEPLDPCWLYIVLPNGYKHFSNYVEFEPHLNQHVVGNECVAERLRAILPKEATYEKDALLSVLVPMMPQAFLTDPQLMKLISLGLMEYRETTIVPTQLLVSLLGMLF